MSEFKQRQCGDQKVSLGPVYSINPKCVSKIEYIEHPPYIGDSWLVIHGFVHELTTELESNACCERVLAECLAINPGIEVVRSRYGDFDDEAAA